MLFIKKLGIISLFISSFFVSIAQNKLNISLTQSTPDTGSKAFHNTEDSLLQFTGRIDSDKKIWQPGVYIIAKFKGDSCEIFLNDEVLYGNSHNYIEIVIDSLTPGRLQTKWKNNKIKIIGLGNTDHVITICKNTEAGIGYLQFTGINCEKLLQLPSTPTRKIECIGNSITCGSGMDLSEIACGKGTWYDQHNAYLSYGEITARALNAQCMLSSVSGIGLLHSCCNMNITMPQVFDKINMRDDSLTWNFNLYIPDVVTVCLGQNDGVQDSTIFCIAYIRFIQLIRQKYPDADIICLSSPMADVYLSGFLKNYITSIVYLLRQNGDKKIHYYFFSKQYHNGCGGHPDMQEHKMIAAELTRFIRKLKHW